MSAGACAECWGAKSAAGRPVFLDPGAKTERFFGFNLDVFDLLPGWGWLALGSALLAATAVAARMLLG